MNFIEVIENIVKTQTSYHSILEGNEAQTRWMLIDPFILDGLGYTRSDIIVEFNINKEDRINRYSKLDYCILVNSMPRILIEAKSLGIPLFDKVSQLEEYFNYVLSTGEYQFRGLFGILTDGDIYLFYTNSINKDKMDSVPFYNIRLSDTEDIELNRLLEYHKDNITNICNYSLLLSDEDFDLVESYRIDNVENVYNYYLSKSIDLKIESVYLRGRKKKIDSFRALYKTILKEVDNLKPELLYYLAKQEDIASNGIIGSSNFSCSHINSTEIQYKTSTGIIYISLPKNRAMLIDRIIYLVDLSGYGRHNVLINLKEA